MRQSATSQEIKSAFRKLAVLFHPDKNQGDLASSKEKFIMIKQAYDVLIDPIKRKKYDLGLNYQKKIEKNTNSQNIKTANKSKDYSFTERQRKERQEFARQYKNGKKENANTVKAEIPSYSDFKYIMMSIPLAVAILFFVINILSKDDSHTYNSTQNFEKPIKPLVNPVTLKKTKLSPAIMNVSVPWDSIFGAQKFDTLSKRIFYFENTSGTDVIICLKDKTSGKVIRNNYIFADNYFSMKHIPEGEFQILAVYGSDWDKSLTTTKGKVFGSFAEVYAYAYLNKSSTYRFSNTSETIEITIP
ncbi:MAG: J domain-containing protein, partial [Bacteroidota bacterium]